MIIETEVYDTLHFRVIVQSVFGRVDGFRVEHKISNKLVTEIYNNKQDAIKECNKLEKTFY